ncbi:MAG: type II secretion system protein GspN [Polyangiaceae bacterium]|nr:type II secretion system protein GspN [Polyangiaceae bacterium]
MSPLLRRLAKGVGYTLGYVLVLVVCTYLTLPLERVRSRLVAEFNANQGEGDGRLEVASLGTYRVSGLRAEGVKLSWPAPAASDGAKAPKPRALEIEEVRVRAAILGLLVGTLELSFDARLGAGELTGMTSDAGGGRAVKLELRAVPLGDVPALENVAAGIPIRGTLSGTVDLRFPEQKLAKAEGEVKLAIQGLILGDGKTKVKDTMVVPAVAAGDLELEASATDGRLTITKLASQGKDLSLSAEGKVRLRDPFASSLAELTLVLTPSAALMDRDEKTQALFGTATAGGTQRFGGLLDLDPKVKRAKRPDGGYAFRLTGPLSKPVFEPAPAIGAAPSPARRAPLGAARAP